MTDDEIETLRGLLADKTTRVLFAQHGSFHDRVHVLSGFGRAGLSLHPEEDPEPGPVAFTEDGGYIALHGCAWNEFFSLVPVFREESYDRQRPGPVPAN